MSQIGNYPILPISHNNIHSESDLDVQNTQQANTANTGKTRK